MASKKKRGPDLEELLQRSWCYYCERDFEDFRILISHQKAKHFKCQRCGRRLNTAGGLGVHMTQVHKETLTAVDNALPNRADPNLEIFAMEGIPDDILQSHRQRIISQFHQEQATRQAQTGNPPSGAGSNGPAAKKPKLESTSDLKKRLAEHKAKKAAEAGAKADDGDSTAGHEMSRSPDQFHAASPSYAMQPYSAPQASPPQPAFQQPYSQTPYQYVQQPSGMQPPFAQTPPQSHSAFGPPGQQYPTHGPTYTPPQQFSGPAPPFQQPFPGGPQRFGAGSPPSLNQYQPPPQHHSPVQNGNAPRQNNLPSASGLPPRPAFGAPSVNAFEMQQLHHGHMPGQNGMSGHHVQQPPTPTPNAEMQKYLNESNAALATSVTFNGSTSSSAPKSEIPTSSTAPEHSRADKKVSNKRTALIYSDEEISPEEKMAELSRYAFHRPAMETTIGDVEAKQTGPVDETGE
ncbi:MAG: hypothetical protein M1821_002099 [Bathelium mastoideum]|nr:MAG: hypothetical protein M1821_002099 [Bathelium mastoideum]